MKKLLILLFSILISFNSYGAVNYTCDDLQKKAKKAELINVFGRVSKVLQIKNSYELSRSNDTLVCIGDVKLSTGGFDANLKLRMEVLVDDGDGYISYTVERNFIDDGKRKAFYDNGNKKSELSYKDDKLDGIQTHWHLNGQINSESNYKDGKKDGEWTWWFENGRIQKIDNYKDDKRDGKLFFGWENGKKRFEGYYKNDKRDGKLTWWFEDGQLQAEENYKDDKVDGKATAWYENGQIKTEKYYNNGECVSGDCD